MKKELMMVLLLAAAGSIWAQSGPLKQRPDAFAPKEESVDAKAITMASTVEEMASWDRYPTYETYVAMMQRWAQEYPAICTLDTIGTSVQGRLILAAHIEGNRTADLYRPQFFYSSTIHGDEVTGYVMMLRLIDTLLGSYGTSQSLTNLVDETAIYINPLANPDGTYRRGNATVQGSVRYNANNVDLNRNYPDPFGTTKAALQQENEAMIDYFTAHNFKLSANLHGGSEVMNYPWDCFTSLQNPHPQAEWWQEVCHRFVDTARVYDNSHFRDVYQADNGVIAGGDWYVIHGGRQDYVNYYHGCLEVTMEISTQKTLNSERLPEYWRFLAPSFINYIAEIHNLPEGVGISDLRPSTSDLQVYPNPATDRVTVVGAAPDAVVSVYDVGGRRLKESAGPVVDLGDLPAGVYTLCTGGRSAKIIKK